MRTRLAALRPLLLPALIAGHAAFAGEPPLPPDAEIHGLRQLARRPRYKPFPLLASQDGSWPSERVVYRDTGTGATVWRMSANPGLNRHVYSNFPAWNADGSLLALQGVRAGRAGWWVVAADASKWRYFGPRWNCWSPRDPRSAWVLDVEKKELARVDPVTGDRTVLWATPFGRAWMPPPSPDGRWLLLIDGHQDRTAKSATAWIVDTEMREDPRKYDLGEVSHQAWFMKGTARSFMFNLEPVPGRTYRDGQFLCEPDRDGAILQLDTVHFSHAAVSPSGKFVAHYRRDIEVYDVAKGENRVVAKSWGPGGHLSWDAEEEWFVASGGNSIATVWPAEGKVEPLCVPNTQLGYAAWNTSAEPMASPDGTKIGYCSSMMGDGDFYVAVRRLPDPPREVVRKARELTWKPPSRCKELKGYRVWRDGKARSEELTTALKCEVDLAGEYAVTAVEWSGLESDHADATPPKPPSKVQGGALDPWTAELAWEAPPDLDVAYYNVYVGAGASQRAAACRVASPAERLHVEWGLPAGAEVAFAVTSVDGAGNESAASTPVKVRMPKSPDVAKAVAVGKKAPAEIAVELAKEGEYLVWVELRLLRAGPPPQTALSVDGAPERPWSPRWELGIPGPGESPPAIWDFVPAGRQGELLHAFKPGKHTFRIASAADQLEILNIVATLDRSFTPEGITSWLARRPK